MKDLIKPSIGVVIGLLVIITGFRFGENTPVARVGYLSINELVSEIPEYRMQRGKLDTMIYEFNVALQYKLPEFQKKQQAFVKDSATMMDVIKEDKIAELQSLSQSIQVFKQVSEEEVTKVDSNLVQPILNEVQKAIDEVAGQYGYTHIFNADVRAQNGPPMVLFANDESNLKAIVLEEYNQLRKINKQ